MSPFIYRDGVPQWVETQPNPNPTQRVRKYIAEQRLPETQQRREKEQKEKNKTELERMFAEMESRGVTREEIYARIDQSKPGEGVEKLQELAPEVDEVEKQKQAQLKQEYQAEYQSIPKHITGENRANEINALKKKYRAEGLKGQL